MLDRVDVVDLHDAVAPRDAPDSYTKPRHLARKGIFRHPTAAGGVAKSLDRWEWLQKISVIPMAIGTVPSFTFTFTFT